jgi:hypothetical protein
MAKKSTKRTGKRMRRDDPKRNGPNRSATDHIMLAARKRGSAKYRRGPRQGISASVQEAIDNMVQTGSNVIEAQIRAGQAAAERLRFGITNSAQLNTDVNMMIENLVATTRHLGSTWLELISVIIRALGAQQPLQGGGSFGGGPSLFGSGLGTFTQTGKSANATTTSSITPAEIGIAASPPEIVVKSKRVTNVVLDLRPRSPGFSPFVRELVAGNSKRSRSLGSAKFTTSQNPPRFVLTIDVPARQPAGTYTGPVVDSSTKQAGGTLSVTIAG